MSKKVELLNCDYDYVTLPKPFYEYNGSCIGDYANGVTIEALYYGPKSGRFFIKLYSQWQSSVTNRCTGTLYKELNRSDFIKACEKSQCDLPNGIEATIID